MASVKPVVTILQEFSTNVVGPSAPASQHFVNLVGPLALKCILTSQGSLFSASLFRFLNDNIV